MTAYDKYHTPGVYRLPIVPAQTISMRTGVPVFLGLVESSAVGATSSPETYRIFTRWSEFANDPWYGSLGNCSFLYHAVRGFFENSDGPCYVQTALCSWRAWSTALNEGLRALETLRDADLVCVPDIMWALYQGALSSDDAVRMQGDVLHHCQTLGDRFAILDALPSIAGETWDGVKTRVIDQRWQLLSANGALYFPWIRVRGGPDTAEGLIPPCGHVAGVISRTDERRGFHKAPANEVLQGAVGLALTLNDAQQGELNPIGVNCLRVFPGRGIRAWGARTLTSEPAWLYINVRRLFLTAGRWVQRNMADQVFEPNDANLWANITRDLTVYFTELFRRSALKGNTPEEAFYVKCNEETNPKELRDRGEVVTEIGLAPALPYEFIVVRIVQRVSGVTIEGPTEPMQTVTN